MLTIAEALRDLIFEQAHEEGRDPYNHHIWQGDPNLLQSAYMRARGRSAHTHPLNDMDSVMAAVRRSSLFERVGTIPAIARTGMPREVGYAAYKLCRPSEAS